MTHALLLGVPLGDVASAIMCLLFAGGLVLDIRQRRRERAKVAIEAAAATASARTKETSLVGQLKGELERVAHLLEKGHDDFETHRLDCAEWRGRFEQIVEQLADGQAKLGQTLENQQRQISSLAQQTLPAGEPIFVPSNPARRGPRR